MDVSLLLQASIADIVESEFLGKTFSVVHDNEKNSLFLFFVCLLYNESFVFVKFPKPGEAASCSLEKWQLEKRKVC